MESKTTPWSPSMLMATTAIIRRIMNIARLKLPLLGFSVHILGSLGLLALAASFPSSISAQNVQAAPQVGGTTSLSNGNSGQARVAGKGLAGGEMILVPEDFSRLTLSP